jgi:molybdopterin-binding protein
MYHVFAARAALDVLKSRVLDLRGYLAVRYGSAMMRRSFSQVCIESQRKVAQSMAEEDDEFMEQSIRNEIPGTVKEIISDKVLSEIIVETAIGEMAAVITTRSVQDMGLKVGDRVAALVKATNVSIRRQT